MAKVNEWDSELIKNRLNYYNKLSSCKTLNSEAVTLNKIRHYKKPKVYYFDLFKHSRYFDDRLKARLLFGDVVHVESEPAIQKSRPIGDNNANAVIMKLESKRHFMFLNDPFTFNQKHNLLIGRASVRQPHRIRFFERHFNNPLCDIGQVNVKDGKAEWLKPKMKISDHLKYKFILSLEGNDVATNLKWIMSSNSIAVMPTPKYETWFMEGRLIPDHHYIHVKDDYSDLNDKLNFYIQDPDAAQKIIEKAHQYISQFTNPDLEKLLSLLVLEKYFHFTNQLPKPSIEY